MDLTINPKFKDLLPALSEEEFNQLEESILEEGVRESIKVWKNQIIDGHNRYSICQKHNLSCHVKDMFFNDEDEALEWIYINQLGRRNLSDHQRTHYVGRLYNLRKNRHGGERGNQYTVETEKVASGNCYHLPHDEPKTTAEEMAEEFGVSEKTVRTAGKVAEILDEKPEIKAEFLSGKITQKQVIETVKETTETTVEIFVGKIHSEKLLAKIRALADAIGNAERAFSANGLELTDYAPRIAKFNRKVYEQQAKELAQITGE